MFVCWVEYWLHNVTSSFLRVVWNDVRTSELALKLANGDRDRLRDLCGLPISTYFSGVKLRWLIDNIPSVQQAVQESRCMFGTIDSWLIYVCYSFTLLVHLPSVNKMCLECV